MAIQKKNFPLRLDPNIYAALERWAQDELRSVNGHIEYLLREALRRSKRLDAAMQKNSEKSADDTTV